jgi:hypothetical protein
MQIERTAFSGHLSGYRDFASRLIARALELTAQEIRSHGDSSTIGSIMYTGGAAVLGTWTFTPQAAHG